jgi:hypothetical protein
MAQYNYLIEYYFAKEPYTKYRAFFATDEVFQECRVSYYDMKSGIPVVRELYSYFMYDTQKRGKAYFIMEDNPIYVRVIQGLDKATETVQEFDAEQFWSKICPYIHHNRVDEILKEIDKTFDMKSIAKKKQGKLTQTSILLLLYKRCSLFNKMSFKDFRLLVTSYYGIKDCSYKENDCTNGFKCDGKCESCFMEDRSNGMCLEIYKNNRSLFTSKMKKTF